ncbi:hypothetical protein O9G_005444, partial [Rozella allomycis CSF55]
MALEVGIGPNEKINMISANGSTSQCVGCVHGVEVDLLRHTFEMILGKPFEIQAQAVVEHKEDGQVITTLTGPDGKKVQVSFNALPKERHRVADVRSINYATYNAKIVDSDIESDDTEFRYNNLKIKNLQTKRWTTLKIMGRRIPEQEKRPVDYGNLLEKIYDDIDVDEAIKDKYNLKSLESRQKPPVITENIVGKMCSSTYLTENER